MASTNNQINAPCRPCERNAVKRGKLLSHPLLATDCFVVPPRKDGLEIGSIGYRSASMGLNNPQLGLFTVPLGLFTVLLGKMSPFLGSNNPKLGFETPISG